MPRAWPDRVCRDFVFRYFCFVFLLFGIFTFFFNAFAIITALVWPTLTCFQTTVAFLKT